jgi:glycosyltransferase involved in cell wall biosynthesis
MKKPVIVYITNIPVPYRYQLYQSFCSSNDFEGWILFDSLSYGETWATSMDDKVNYEIYGGQSLSGETGKTPLSLKLFRLLWRKSPAVIILSEFSPLLVLQTLLYMLVTRRRVNLISMTDENRAFFDRLSWKPARLLFRKLTLRFVDKCICCSESSREHIEALAQRMKGRTIVSYLTPESCYYDKPAAKELQPVQINLLTVCRLVELKRVDRLIQAAKILDDSKDVPNWRLTIVGDGPEEPRLREMVRSLGLEEKVLFQGRLVGEKVHQAYRDANIFLLTSDQEVWGVVVHEAMLNGLVPVVTKAVGSSELVLKGGGIVIDDSGEESAIVGAIASTLQSLLSNPEKMKRMQRECLKYAGNITIAQEVASYLSAVL